MLSIVTLAPGTKFRRWTDAFLAAEWGSAVARGGELVDPTLLEGVVALRFSEPVGAATYLMQADALEIVTLNATVHRLASADCLSTQSPNGLATPEQKPSC